MLKKRAPFLDIPRDLHYDRFRGLKHPAKGFHATQRCTGCGRCVRLCTLNNIAMRDARPTWGEHCTHCMACIQRCPTAAIEYKHKTQGKARYALTK